MGYWTNSTYIRSGDTDAVAGALTRVLEGEGMRLISRPPERDPAPYDPMQYGDAAANDLWALAVFPGAEGWTVIKTAPLSLLGERSPGAPRMRLSDLCARLGTPGFHLIAYDSSGGVLAEADGQGGCRISGHCSAGGGDPMDFHGEAIEEDRVDLRFEILPLQHVVDSRSEASGPFRIIDVQAVCEALEEMLGGENARLCDNLTSVLLEPRRRTGRGGGGAAGYSGEGPANLIRPGAREGGHGSSARALRSSCTPPSPSPFPRPTSPSPAPAW